MSSRPVWLESLRAALVLAVGLWMVLLGTPGLDTLRRSELESQEDRAAAFEQLPDPLVWLGIGITSFNREVRLPVVDKLEFTQRFFRIAQTWSLYRNGPPEVRHLEIHIDGELVHRSQSTEHTWRTAQLRNRRIRPMVEATCMSRRSKNWKGLGRWVAAEARRDFPDAKSVSLRCLDMRFPGTGQERLSHQILAKTPDWTPRMPK